MDEIQTDRLLRLIEIAIQQSSNVAKEATAGERRWMMEDAITAQKQFGSIRDRLLRGDLQPSDGAGLGITRALSEWAPERLYDAGRAVEVFYIEEWNEPAHKDPANS